MVSVVEKGTTYTPDYRLYFKNENGPISPFHDIPLVADKNEKLYNMVVEIPRWTQAKMEINTSESLNPIKQDVKKDKMRFVANVFPFKGYIWNYGALPQTWENPLHKDEATGCKGDNDPIDVLEIGSRIANRGDVLNVKLLGCVALIDEGETDWKIFAIDVKDPLASQVNDIADIDTHFPGLLRATIEWFKIYKIPDGKPENQFAFNGEAKDRSFAVKVVEEVHEYWKALVKGEAERGPLSIANVTVEGSAERISVDQASQTLNAAPKHVAANTPQDQSIQKWHFIKLPKN